MRGAPSGTVTFLFTDIEGSTRLWAAEQSAMATALEQHDRLLREAIESRGGYVFATGGDAFAAAFGRASDAVEAALVAHAALADQTWPTSSPVRVRMGLHTGEAEERDGNYFGPTVNLAARVGAAGHGGQILLTGATAALITAPYRDLGDHRLRDIEHPVRLLQVDDGVHPPVRASDPDRVALPVPTSALVGRAADIDRVRRLLVTSPVVTLTGVGGSGKTRLALEIGAQEVPSREAGVYFVDLAPIATPEEVAPAISSTLRLVLGGGDPVEEIVSYLSDKNALVIIDNCEHVIEAVADVAQVFVGRHGDTRLLLTSRELLDIDGETVVAVTALPPAEATELLGQRARAVDPAFDVEKERDTAAELCRRLDFMPLAIELAAARLSVMSVKELLERLDDRFRLLAGKRRGNKTRTLEATLAWSYDLLVPEEQRFFRWLGVFPGSFDVDAAAAVGGLDGIGALDLLDALAAKSLVVVDHVGVVTRYHLLETIRAYAESRLLAAEESAEARDAHLEHFNSRFGRAEFAGATDLRDLAVVVRDLDNVVAAIEWGRANQRWQEVVRLVSGAAEAWSASGVPGTGRAYVALALEHCPREDVVTRDYLRWCDGNLAQLIDDWPGALATLTAIVQDGSPEVAVGARANLAFARWAGGDLAAARDDLAEARRIGADAKELWNGYLQWVDGSLALSEGDLSSAREIFAAGLGPDFTSFDAFNILAVAALDAVLGRPEAALAMLDEHDWELFPIGSAEIVRAAALAAMGEAAEARTTALAFARRANLGRIRRQANDGLVGLAVVALHSGEREMANEMLIQAGIPRSPHTIVLSLHLAERLGVLEEVRQMMETIRTSGTRHDARAELSAWLQRLSS